MKHCSESHLLLLKPIFITLFTAVLEADQVKASSVTEYLGHDVTLPCQFTQEPNTSITQVQWDLMSPEGNKNRIIVSNPRFGVNISESPLKDRVEITEQSLIIKNVQISDAGSYICSIAAFPSGSFEGTTKLIVREEMLFSPGVISAMIAVTLLVGILAAIAYLIFIRRGSSVRPHVTIDTSGLVMDATRRSVISRDKDVVYSDVKLKTSRDASPLSSHRDTETVNDVTYAEVIVLRQQPQ